MAQSSLLHRPDLLNAQTSASEKHEETVFYVTYPADDGSQAYRFAREARLKSQNREELEAIGLADQAIAAATETNALPIKAWALCMKSTSAAVIGLREEALTLAEEALRLAESIDDETLQARAYFCLAFVALETNDPGEAEKLLERSLAFAESAQSNFDLFWALNNLAHVYGEQAAQVPRNREHAQWQDKHKKFLQTSRRALDVAKKVNAPEPRCYAMLNLANALLLDENYAQAKLLIEDYAAIAKAVKNTRLMAYANLDRARHFEALGQFQDAIDVIDSPRHHEQSCDTDDLRLTTQEMLARLNKTLNNFEVAYAHLANARTLEREIYLFQAERHLRVLSTRIEMQEAHANAERFRQEAQNLEIRNTLLEQERKTLKRNAMLDPLTNLGNRRAADVTFARQIDAALSTRDVFQLVYVDLDFFKKVNDTFGHLIGDKVLVKVAEILRKATRPTDRVFRFGGEEFVLMLKDQDSTTAMATCLRLKERISDEPWGMIAQGLTVTASFGLAQWKGELEKGLLEARADKALYLAKEGGRNRVVLG